MAAKSKTRKKAGGAELPAAIQGAMAQVWKAGLGAFSRAQKEGGEAFADLVKQGAQLQAEMRNFARGGMHEVSSSAGKAADSLGRFEGRLEASIAHALHTLGVADRGDFNALVKRVDALGKPPKAPSGARSPAARPKAAPARKATKASRGKAHAKPRLLAHPAARQRLPTHT